MIFFQEKLLAKIDIAKLNQILSNYGNFKVVSFHSQSGWQNLTLKVKTYVKTFVLRIYRTGNFEKINFSLDVIEYLAKSNFKVQNLAKPANNSRIIRVKIGKSSHFAVLFEYIDGKIYNFLTAKQLEVLGGLSAKLHQKLEQFDRTYPQIGKISTLQIFRNVNSQLTARFENESNILKLWQSNKLPIFENIYSQKKFLGKTQLIHGDLAPSNILFGKNKILAILDFDDLKIAPRIWDLVNFVGNYSQTIKGWGQNEKTLSVLAHLVKGYKKNNNLEVEEEKLIPFLLRLWFFKKIVWAQGESAKKYRQKWAKEVMSWCVEALEEKF